MDREGASFLDKGKSSSTMSSLASLTSVALFNFCFLESSTKKKWLQ